MKLHNNLSIKKEMETTTDKFQEIPDYWETKEDCDKHKWSRAKTNPRYPYFEQTHFTAGDEEQFKRYRNPINNQICIPDIDLDKNIFRDIDLDRNVMWKRYEKIGASAVSNTFTYIFEKFKKGIFVQIKNNELTVFLPFSKINYKNEWSDKIKVSSVFGNMKNFLRHINEMEGRKFNPKRVNNFVDRWYGNNSLVRYEFPIGEGDSGVPMMSDMFRELCRSRKVPDIEFFINRRDFPIITRDGTEPYDCLFGTKQPLLSHNYQKYCPILAGSISDKDADIPIPTWEDWQRISYRENKFFTKPQREFNESFNTPWSEKIPTAVFRGSSTGAGTTMETNPRLKIAYLSTITPPDKHGKLLDAGINKWNLRPRKTEKDTHLQTIQIHKLPFKKVNTLTPEQQSKYKYIINIQGHVAAYRLSLELCMGSVILLVKSKYRLWYSNYLEPYVHYIPVKEDLSDLIDQIKWCRNNDERCEQIAKNALEFYNKYLKKDSILDYLQKLLICMKRTNGVYFYNYMPIFDIQIKEEQRIINRIMRMYPRTKRGLEIHKIPSQPRSYNLLQGIRWAINRIMKSEPDISSHIKEICIIKRSRLSQVKLCEFGKRNLFALKETSNIMKKKEGNHEAFVGLTCINELIKKIPNFSYIFGIYNSSETTTSILSEYIDGQTFDNYIADQSAFNLREYFWIMIQICLSLHVALNACGFMHCDLVPWNIIIQRVKEPVTVYYPIADTKVIRVTTRVIPIIIDYGKSNCIYQNRYYGFVKHYKISTIHDILTLFLTSIYLIVTKQVLNKWQSETIIKFSNFIGGSRYTGNVKFRNLNEVRFFTNSAKKYAEILRSDKYELEGKTPLDLFEYLTTFQHSGNLQEINKLRSFSFEGNSNQVYEFIFSKNVEESISSFIKVFDRILGSKLPKYNDLLSNYYIIQSIYTSFISVYRFLEEYLVNNQKPRDLYKNKYTAVIEYLEQINTNRIKNFRKRPTKTLTEPDLTSYNYTEKSFEDIVEMKDLHLQFSKIKTNIERFISKKKIFESVLLYSNDYSIGGEHLSYLMDQYKILLNTDNLKLLRALASRLTFLDISEKVIRTNCENIKGRLLVEIGSKNESEEYLRISSEIFE